MNELCAQTKLIEISIKYCLELYNYAKNIRVYFIIISIFSVFLLPLKNPNNNIIKAKNK